MEMREHTIKYVRGRERGGGGERGGGKRRKERGERRRDEGEERGGEKGAGGDVEGVTVTGARGASVCGED